MEERQHPNNPLHGVTLLMMLNALVQRHGWKAMGQCLDIRCFTHDPNIKSSLVFLRKEPWARKRVEEMYLTGDLTPKKRKKAAPKRAGVKKSPRP